MRVKLQAVSKVEFITRPVIDTAKVEVAEINQKQVLDPKIGVVFDIKVTGDGSLSIRL